MASQPPLDDYLNGGRAVAPAFGLDVGDLRLLSHSENMVLALTTVVGEQFAMRLHRPGYNTVAELESEVEFVNSLRRFGVSVPQAIATTSGAHYVATKVGEVEHQVGVVGWVAGAPLGGPLDAPGPEIVDHYHQIGQLAAQIRAHYATWQSTDGFVRRQWNRNSLLGDAPLWGRFWEVAALSPAQRELFSAARQQLDRVVGSLPIDPESFGLIHADLHLGNVMADGPDLTIIDFDDAGFGYFVHELAVALHPMLGDDLFDQAKASLINGYRQVHPLSEFEVELIDDFLAMRSLMIIGWLADRPEVPIYERFGELANDVEAHITTYLSRSKDG